MLYSLLGNNKIIKNNLNLINLPHVGMIGYQIAGLNFNTNRLLDTKFNLINCHRKYYPSDVKDPGKVKVVVKDKLTKQKVKKEINFFTQKNFNEKILDRIFVSSNLKINEKSEKIIEKLFCSDHVILSAYFG